MAGPANFIWGAGGAQLTPEEIALQRAVLAKKRLAGVDTSPIGSWTQGAARVVDALGDVMQERRLNEVAATNKAEQDSQFNTFASYLTGGQPAAPVGQAQPIASAPVASPVVPGDMNSYRNAIASIESAGSGDYGAIGPTNSKLGRALGRYQIMEANIQPWAQEALGRPVSTEEFMSSPQIQDAIFDSKFGSYVNKFGPAGAAQAWFAGPGGVGKNDRADVLGTTVGGYSQKFMNALGQPPAYTDPSVVSQPQPASPLAVGAAPQDATPPLPSPITVANAPAVAAVPAAQAQASSIGRTPASPALIQALKAVNSPYSSEATKGIAKILIDQYGAQQKLSLADQQRQQEISRRQSVAQQIGVNPAFAQDDETWKAATGNVFATPSTSTVGSTIVDNRTGKPIYEGKPNSPTSVQEYEYAKGQGYTGSYQQYTADMKRASANNTTINNGEGNKFYNVLDEQNAKVFSGLSNTGMEARSNLVQADQLGKLLESTPTGAIAALKQAAGEYGINTEGLSDIQAATSLINKLVPAQRQPGSGSMSDQDLALFKQSLPRLINQPGANATIINTIKGINQYQIAMGEIADKVANRERKQDGEVYTPADARRDIANLPNPLAGFKPPPKGKEDEGWKPAGDGIRFRPIGN